jgi:hypothetical protein
MTKIKLNKAIGGHDKGATIDVTPGVAEHFKARGLVEETKAAPKSTARTADKPDA